jgi:ABC-2 type transport system ATP-binding protein
MTNSTLLTAPAVDLSGLTRRYGEVVAVDALDLRLEPGEVVALLGPNGAGKSTTVDMLLGLTRPDAGAVHLFGRTPREAVEQGLVGAMLQNSGLPDDVTVAELVELYASLHRAALPTGEALARAGVADLGGPAGRGAGLAPRLTRPPWARAVPLLRRGTLEG